jgi:hypothetical protein
MESVSTSQMATQLASQIDPAQSKRVQLQVALLRKTLDVQQQEAAQLMKMMEGKGQNIDIRV